jgi:tetratricopeptide (TPR) repeat protein
VADDWYRNTSWSAEIETAFFQRLAKARRKTQYLRIQASTLARTRPDVALRLLEQYFALGAGIDEAQAHVDRARALIAQGSMDLAIGSLYAAMARERTLQSVQTQAYLELPHLIALERRADHYEKALQILTAGRDRLTFAAENYKWWGTLALLLHDQGQKAEAEAAARRALEFATVRHSGLPSHPAIGVVGDTADEFGRRLRQIARSLN